MTWPNEKWRGEKPRRKQEDFIFINEINDLNIIDINKMKEFYSLEDIANGGIGENPEKERPEKNESAAWSEILNSLSARLTEPERKEEYIKLGKEGINDFINEYSNKIFREKKNKTSKEEYFSFSKNLKSGTYTHLASIISKKFSSLQISPLGLNLNPTRDASIGADNLAEYILPIVEYIHSIKPDYVVASDRGARLIGLAVFRLYGELYGRFPTSDGTLRFRRFSKSNSLEQTEEHLKPLVDEMLSHKDKPTVLVLDDWVVSGGTQRMARGVFDKLGKGKIKVKYGVLIGPGADVSGHDGQNGNFGGSVDWHDDTNVIGVDYRRGSDSWKKYICSPEIKAHAVRSDGAINYRRRVYRGINNLVRSMDKKAEHVA